MNYPSITLPRAQVEAYGLGPSTDSDMKVYRPVKFDESVVSIPNIQIIPKWLHLLLHGWSDH